MERCLIVAVADNLAIGRDNALLWHISEDLKWFKSVTMGCPVIMGRRTFESIGRALPGRLNIVVTRGFDAPEGVRTASSPEEAFGIAEASAVAGENGPQRCFVIGGGQIYERALPLVDRLYVTRVHTVIPDADTFFPEISADIWKEESVSETHTDPSSGLSYEFAVYCRI